MKRNRTLQKMLEDYRPDLGNSNEYMEQLQRRLETVEAVKQLYETERRRTRSQMAVAFASGGVTGAIVAVCFLLHPIHIANPAAQPGLKIFSWMLEHSDLLVPTLTVAFLAVCAAVAATQVYGIVKKDYSM